MSSKDTSVNTLIAMFSKLTLYTLLASHVAGAALIPRQVPVVTVTNMQTHTVYAAQVVTPTHTIPYTSTQFSYAPAASSVPAGIGPIASSVQAGMNPINGLPVLEATSSTVSSESHPTTSVQLSSSSQTASASGIVITPLTFATVEGTPTLVPYNSHLTSSAQSTASSSHSSAEAPKPSSSSTETPKPSSAPSASETSEASTSTSSRHSHTKLTIILFPSSSHTSSTHEPSKTTSTPKAHSTGSSDGEIGEEPDFA